MAEATNDTVLPREAAQPSSPRRLEVWLPIAIVVLDQITKAIVRSTLAVHESVTIVPGLMDFTHVRNAGAAFGILNTTDFPFKTFVIALIAAAALVGVGLYAGSLARHQLVARLGLALIIGGAAGNLVDRLLSAGHDVDVLAEDYSDTMGHAGAAVLHPNGTLEAGHDPRADGGARGV